jgi:uncharacterized membrane protein
MQPLALHYFPVARPALLLLISLFALIVGMMAARIMRIAAADMGVSGGLMVAVLLGSLLGSYVNIPVAYLPERAVSTATEVTFFGIRYVIPTVTEWPATMLAINVGGAVIPTLLSAYLIAKNRLYLASLAGISLVALVCHLLARPVRGVGIAEPIFVPALTTAVVAVLVSRRYAGPLAYVSGSLGTLVGADLLNLNKLQGLGAPVASIGGAGTFDGIFITGLLAVLYAGLVRPPRAQKQ